MQRRAHSGHGRAIALACLATIALACATASEASAAPPSTSGGSPYKLSWGLDLPVLGVGGALSLAALVEVPPPACLPSSCDPSDINALDRQVLGRYSKSLRTASDVVLIGMLAVPLIVDLIDSRGHGFLADAVVMAEAVIVAQGLTQLVKAAVRRPAPFVYNDSVDLSVRRDSADAPRAFWSGHAATAFSAAAAFSTTFWLRHADSPWRWVVIAASAALATTVGLLKIRAGYHYWTDIFAGAAAGAASGVAIPLLHRR